VDKAYWVRRKRASMKAAHDAGSPEAQSVHYELAARYDANATHAEALATYAASTVGAAFSVVRSPRSMTVTDNA
jgi:putative heme iron utilization protein